MKMTMKRILLISSIVFLLVSTLIAGDIFEAKIYRQGTDKGEFMFLYRNSVMNSIGYKTLTHYYFTPDKELFAKERVVLKNDTMITHKTDFIPVGIFSHIENQDNKLKITHRENGETKTEYGTYPENPVFGPTQQSFIRENLQRFKAGERVVFQLPAPQFHRFIDFRMKPLNRSEYDRDGVMVLEMSSNSLLLRLFVGKNQYVIDEENGRILEIHGPSLLREKIGDKWEYIDTDIYFEYKDK